MGKNKNRNNKGQNSNTATVVATPATASTSESAAETVIQKKPEATIVNAVSLSDISTSDPMESVSSNSAGSVESEQEAEEPIITGSFPATNAQNLCDVSFRNSVSVSGITFEKSPTVQPPARGNEDDYLLGSAAPEDDNTVDLIILSGLEPLDLLDVSTGNIAPSVFAGESLEESDHHQNNPVFVRPHDLSTTQYDSTEPEETIECSVVSSATNYVNNRLLGFVDAMDLTKSSDIADAILNAVRWEHLIRRHAPLPLFVIELLIFLPRFHLVTFIFLLRIFYNLICFGVRAHVYVASIPLQIMESMLVGVFQVVVSLAVMFLNQAPGGQTVPKGLNGHSGSKHRVH